MKNPVGTTITAWVNFCILSLLLLDVFVFKPVPVLELFREGYSSSVGSGTIYGRSRYYLEGGGEHRYKVPESVYYEMNHERSQYTISRSSLFKRPLQISYVFDNNPRQENLNVLNNLFGEILTALMIIVSLLNLTSKPFIPNKNFNQRAVPICSIILFWILNFYFSW
ncbi:MAG: hypothetical protein ABUT20_03350 [Bacteroidota bacterium]